MVPCYCLRYLVSCCPAEFVYPPDSITADYHYYYHYHFKTRLKEEKRENRTDSWSLSASHCQSNGLNCFVSLLP